MKCPNFKNFTVRKDFEDLERVLFTEMAYQVYVKNDGNPIYKTKNGEDSLLFQELNEKFGYDRAIEIKSHMYSDVIPFGKRESSFDAVGEPTISQFERFFPKNEVAKKSNPVVHMKKNFNQLPLFSQALMPSNALPIVDSNNHYLPGYFKGSTQVSVANRFFRYMNPDGTKSKPSYPYRYSTDPVMGQRYVEYINKHYDRAVVTLNRDSSITFLDKANEAKYKGISDRTVLDSPVTGFDDKGNWIEESEPGNEFFNEGGSNGIFDLTPEEMAQSKKNAEAKAEPKETTVIDDTIFVLENRKSILEKRIKARGGNSAMEAAVSSINIQIEKLEQEKRLKVAPGILKDMANQDSKILINGFQTIRENMDNLDDLSADQILPLIDSVVRGGDIIKGWTHLQAMDEYRKDPMMAGLRELDTLYKDLNADYNDIIGDLFTAYANQVSSRSDFAKDDILKAIDDIGTAKSLTSNIGSSGVDLLEIVDDIINKADFQANEDRIAKKTELKVWQRVLKKAGISKKDVNEAFKQLDSKGNWTGNIVGQISHKFYEAREETRAAVKDKNVSKRKYREWMRENTNHFSEENLKDLKAGKRKSSSNLGYSKHELEHQERMLTEYENDLNANKDLAEDKYGEDSNEAIEEIANWERSNSPYLFANSQDNGGAKYLLHPKPKVEKWADVKYEEIKKNKPLHDFYLFMQERFTENNKSLGYFNEFEEFYMPELDKGLIGKVVAQRSVRKGMAMIWNSGIDAMTDELDNIEDIGDNIGGKVRKSIPIHMMSDRIAPAMKDGDIFRVLDSHTEMSLNHRYKSEIEPLTNAATDLLDTMKEIENVDSDGQKIPKQRFGKIRERSGQLNNTKALLEYAIDAHIYGKRKDIEGTIAKVRTTEYVAGENNDEVIAAENQKRVTGSAVVDTLISYTYLKAMSLPNIVTPAVNMMFGINSNLIYASAGEDFDLKTYRIAAAQMMAITARSFGGETNSELVNKTFAFMEKFQIIGDIHDSEYGKKKTVSEKITILQSKAEVFVQGSTMLSMLKFHKLKDNNGKEVSIFDAYKFENDKLSWDAEKMGGELIEVASDRVFDTHRRGVNEEKLMSYIDRVNAKISGNYKDPMMAKKTAIGRMFTLFKTWLPEAIDHRFGGLNLDKDLVNKDGKLGRETKGRYRSYYKPKNIHGLELTIAQTIGMMLKGVVTKKAFNELSDVDKVNLMRNLKEIQQIATVYLVAALMKGLLMEDDDEAKPMLNLAINTLTKSGADLSFFVSPNSASQVLDNLIPVVSTLKDIEGAISAVSKTIQGDAYIKSGPQEGYSRVLIGGSKTIPGLSGGMKLWNLSSKVVEANR